MIETLQFVDHGVDLGGVVGDRLLRQGVGLSGVDFRNKEIIHAGAGRPLHEVVSGVLVGPGRAKAGLMRDLEDCVHPRDLMRIDRRAVCGGIGWKLGGIDARVSLIPVDVDGF